MSTVIAAHAAAIVSRQPILDLQGRVFGYELRHRLEEGADGTGARGLTDLVLDMGLETLSQGKRAFLNFSRDLLLGDAATLAYLQLLTVLGQPDVGSASLLRARCCEELGRQMAGRVVGSEMFLMGLCSQLDVILNRPLADALADLPLTQDIRAALLGEQNTARAVLDVVVANESGNRAGELSPRRRAWGGD